jgi:hypothetical protein
MIGNPNTERVPTTCHQAKAIPNVTYKFVWGVSPGGVSRPVVDYVITYYTKEDIFG